MFRLSSIMRKLAIVSVLILLLGVFSSAILAQEAPRDSGTLIKPPTIKPPTARTQATNRGTVRSRTRRSSRTKRRAVVRRRRSVRRATTASKRVPEKPLAVGVSVDPTVDVPERVADTPPTTIPVATTKPRRPISGGVLNGRAVSLPVPVYPPLARAARASGQVVVQVLIDEEGNVEEAKAVAGHPLLQAAAVEAARNAKFPPTTLRGQPVKVTGVITYNFVE